MHISVARRALIALGLTVPLALQSQVGTLSGHAAGIAPVTGPLQPGTLTPKQVQQLAAGAADHVIIILRDQEVRLAPTASQQPLRAAAFAAVQGPILAELRQVQAQKVQSFRLINAIAATVSPAEAKRLVANPTVKAVVPDRFVSLPRPSQEQAAAATSGGAAGALARGATSGAAPAALPPACNTLEPEALQLTNDAFPDPAVPQAQQVVDSLGHKINGAGVKVAWIADGLDPNIPGFIRPDGSHVFVDYQSFSGFPTGSPTDGAEAFLDASSIAAQDDPNGTPLSFDISQYVNAAHPLPSPCNIKILGMAPGASLVGLDVIGGNGGFFVSVAVQAVEYAVLHDHVDVINESFGGNPFPDNANDPIALADDAAVAAGVSVVVSTGDSGTANTIGSPASDPNVINAGATTQFRTYAQTGDAGIQLGNGGYIDNNISSFSSAGFTQSGPRTVDVVAPGDFGWALCSTNTAIYTACADPFNGGTPQPIQQIGGTSESAPLTSGEAALVIQAYRDNHGGASPSPALVKQIIMSTATDLGIPGYEQGAGLINALKAVQAALSVHDAHGSPAAQGNSLLVTPNSFSVDGAPNTKEHFSVTVTNVGTTSQVVLPRVQTLGAPSAGATTTVQLNTSTDPTFVDIFGLSRPYVIQTFTVPPNMQRLDAAIAFKTSQGGLVRLTLFDPSGRLAAYSNPSSLISGYGHVDVRYPAGGTWKALIWTHSGSTGYTGPVQFSWSASNVTTAGIALPGLLALSPGASATFTVLLTTPALPGDASYTVSFVVSSHSGVTPPGAIPISLRSLVPLSATGGSFTGVLTGGNGGLGQTLTYAFDVPSGLQELSANMQITDNQYNLEGLLVDPNGQELDVESNIIAEDQSGNPTAYSNALQLYHYNPQPGRWRFILFINNNISGNQTSLPFTAHIGFNTAQITATGLPNSASVTLHAGQPPVTIPVHITNTGLTTESYFVDARGTGLIGMALPSAYAAFVSPGLLWFFPVPTETSAVVVGAESYSQPVPIEAEIFNEAGANPGGFTFSPDVLGPTPPTSDCTSFIQFDPNTDTACVDFVAPEVPYGPWLAYTSELGPFGPDGLVTDTNIGAAAVAVAAPFDAAVSASSGDIVADEINGTNTYSPLVLAPGQSGTINVTITPDPTQVGNNITGNLYVDTFNQFTGSGGEVVRIPYSYTVAQ